MTRANTTIIPHDGRRALTVRLPDDMHRELKHLAVDDDVTVNDIVVQAVHDLLRVRRTPGRKR